MAGMDTFFKTAIFLGPRSWAALIDFILFSRSVLKERVDAVEEILASSSEKLVTLRIILKGLPDLAKGLCRIQYGQVRRN